jgi:hypothetical protein
MAEIFTDEGLDYCLNVLFRGGTLDTTLFVGLFTSQTPTTVPARTATGGASPSGWTEMAASSGTYARQAIAADAASWAAPATNGSGRRIVANAAEQFTGFVGAAAANGFFVATASASGAGDTILFFSNFDSGVSRTFGATGDELNLTPRIQFDG